MKNRVDGSEEIQMCLNCELEDCVNCLARDDEGERQKANLDRAKRWEAARAMWLEKPRASAHSIAVATRVSDEKVRRIREQLEAEGLLKPRRKRVTA